MSDALKPCPFCGSVPQKRDVGDYFVTCPGCGIDGPAGDSDGLPHAADAWNTRADSKLAAADAQLAAADASANECGSGAGCPCEIIEADFEHNTVTLKMNHYGYIVAAGLHYLVPADAASQPVDEPCRVDQPAGWRCTRANGHKGPCAAVEDRA